MKKFLLMLFCVTLVAAAEFPQKQGAVNDFAKVISAQAAEQIESLAIEVFNKTGVAIVICTMPTIGEQDYRQYANELYSFWGIGRKGEDRGVLIFNVVDTRKLWLETGYGVEGFLPDAVVGDIYRQHLVPHLRSGDYSGGFLAATQAIAGLVAKEYNVTIDGSIEPQSMQRTSSRSLSPLCTLAIVVIILFILL